LSFTKSLTITAASTKQASYGMIRISESIGPSTTLCCPRRIRTCLAFGICPQHSTTLTCPEAHHY
jgi:hypothetical protein